MERAASCEGIPGIDEPDVGVVLTQTGREGSNKYACAKWTNYGPAVLYLSFEFQWFTQAVISSQLAEAS